MPAHNYNPIPLEDEIFSTFYNTGIPSTAPPSFHSVPLSAERPSFDLPHRNDETAATRMPPSMFERPRNRPPIPASLAGDDPAYPISIWAPSTTASELGVDLEAAREDVVARLSERVEELERRLAGGRNGDGDGVDEGQEKKKKKNGRWSLLQCCELLGIVLFVLWICATVTLAVAARYKAAGYEVDT